MMALARPPDDLIEREWVFGAALGALNATTASGTATSVLLVGRAGVGTSRLAAALAQNMAARGAQVFDWAPGSAVEVAPAGEVAVVDDVHRFDPPSAAVLAAWLRTDPTHRLIATGRPGQPLPEGIADHWSSGRIARYDLAPLTIAGTEQLATRLLGGAVTRGLVQYLATATEGLPLLIRELVADTLADGAVIHSNGVWVGRGDSLVVGQRVRDLCRSRVVALGDTDRHVIDVVAESGGAPARVLVRVVDAGDLDHCEQLGEVTASDRGFLEIRPPIVALALRQTIGQARRSTLRRALADAIAVDPDPPDDLVLRAATWSLDDGVHPSPELAIAAAGAANRSGDYASARRLASAAVGSPLDGLARLAASHALRLTGRGAEALAVLDARPAPPPLDAGAGPDPDADHLGEQFAMARASIYQYVLDDADAGIEVLDAYRGTAPNRRIDLQRLVNLCFAGRFAECVPELDAHARDPLTTTAELTSIAGPLAVARAFSGRSREALHLAELGESGATDADGEALLASSEIGSAAFLIRSLFGVIPTSDADITGPAAISSLVQLGIGVTRLGAGDAGGALDEVEKAIAALSVSDPVGFLAFGLSVGARAAVEAGRLGRAAELADRLHDTPLRASGLVEPEIRRNLLFPAFAAGGAVKVATEGFSLISDCRRHGLFGIELLTRHTMMRLGVAGAAPTRELLAANDSSVARTIGAHFEALVAADADGLLRAATEFETLQRPIEAAEAAAQAHHMARDQGSTTRARTAGQRVRALTRELDTSAYPLLQDWSSFQQLTNREREVVALARQHLTNGEIAERLGRSRRTIEGHLHRAYTKLGVSDRTYLE